LRIIPLTGNPDRTSQGVNRVPNQTNGAYPMLLNNVAARFNSLSDLYSNAFAVLSKETIKSQFARKGRETDHFLFILAR
jgi:hypothetical protein